MYAVPHSEGMVGITNKKRKMMLCDALNFSDFAGDSTNLDHESKTSNVPPLCSTGRRFLTLYKKNNNSVYHTEEWLPCGSTLFSPLTEDIMVNTQNIEQFSSSSGQYFVSDERGQYSATLTGQVLHLWRFCPTKQKLFISRSFLFQEHQDFLQVQQFLQQL
ncbi:hypothetical protein EGW08_008399 [Elysia chlorotica]|uniref:Uncharacterized protein n=1 Tax=Elysia chlorotica TaxID=188477 RepID=A0A3S1HPZ2_ELYCH|nr:hypothetical protein EGW08_008399 [Elysia chlorotica]